MVQSRSCGAQDNYFDRDYVYLHMQLTIALESPVHLWKVLIVFRISAECFKKVAKQALRHAQQ